MAELKRNEKIDIVELLKDLDKYEPRRRGWTWRERAEDQHMGPFEYREISKPLKQSVPLPPASIIPFMLHTSSSKSLFHFYFSFLFRFVIPMPFPEIFKHG